MGRLDPGYVPGCPLCRDDGGLLLAQTPALRVVRVTDTPDYPGFYRVICTSHVSEFSDLPPEARHTLMEAVATVERLVREHLRPDKVNLASLGNVVPHLHWHVIARHADDRHFPQPIWGAVQRDDVTPDRISPAQLVQLDQTIAAAFQADIQA